MKYSPIMPYFVVVAMSVICNPIRKMLIKQTQKPKSNLLQKSSSLLTVFIFTLQNSVFK